MKKRLFRKRVNLINKIERVFWRFLKHFNVESVILDEFLLILRIFCLYIYGNNIMKESYVKLLKNIERENSILAENRMSVFNIKHKNEKNVRIYHRFEDFVETIEKLVCIDTTIDVYISLDKYTDVSYINDNNIKKYRYMKMRFVIKNDIDYNIEDVMFDQKSIKLQKNNY